MEVELESVNTFRAEKNDENKGKDIEDQPPTLNCHPEREGERAMDKPAKAAS